VYRRVATFARAGLLTFGPASVALGQNQSPGSSGSGLESGWGQLGPGQSGFGQAGQGQTGQVPTGQGQSSQGQSSQGQGRTQSSPSGGQSGQSSVPPRSPRPPRSAVTTTATGAGSDRLDSRDSPGCCVDAIAGSCARLMLTSASVAGSPDPRRPLGERRRGFRVIWSGRQDRNPLLPLTLSWRSIDWSPGDR
jgi:hypothetical protein